MVRPGMINLDFADVETVMSTSGKAMMGTGEADGENRAMAATELALNNPLIDEYTLQGAKGLLVNITGGSDIKLFEVDAAVNKIRAEVDPEAELIFGAIKDEDMNGKIRVSIVATSLEGSSISPEPRPVLNVVNGSNIKNNNFSENLFSKNNLEKNVINSIDGATALKLDESYEFQEEQKIDSIGEFEKNIENNSSVELKTAGEQDLTSITSGVSIESASYIENNNLDEATDNSSISKNHNDELTPQLFSEEKDDKSNEENLETFDTERDNSIELFDQDTNEEEDFEIPAFLRKQKF